MKQSEKYRPMYFMPPEEHTDWVKQDRLTKAPVWCSVDLRDGNQALIAPMSLDEKLAYFEFLLGIGFKEIEIGFPAASETEYAFTRALIEGNRIPDDVTIQVLTQSRAHIIEKTFAAVKGAPRVIVHLYNSTSYAQRQQVFKMTEKEIIAIAEEGARMFNTYAGENPDTRFAFEYSPESFTGTEMEFSRDICNAVIDIWKPSAARPVIINLPATVENSMPHVYAQQIAYMSRNLRSRENVVISLHPHNDRGTGVAAAELGLLAGAQRVEGTIMGNGERTGNVDIVTLALNLYTHGVNPQLDLSDMPRIVRAFEEVTGLPVGPRHPYAGELVFAAFSGSHQDAIAKGMQFRKEGGHNLWSVPYLPIDPEDVNRRYETSVIRINSQSGKGGIALILEDKFGYILPKELKQEVGYFIKDISDREHKELSPDDILRAFSAAYVNVAAPLVFESAEYRRENDRTRADVSVALNGARRALSGTGNGSLDAVSHALRGEVEFSFADYAQHALESDSDARAAAYVKITDKAGKPVWGVGVHNDITTASVLALFSAVNRLGL